MNKLVILGASGHGKVIADIAELNGYTDICFLDDDTSLQTCMSYPVCGVVRDYVNYPEADFVVAIGNAKIRYRFQQELISEGLNVVTLIHPSAVVSGHATVGRGTVVMAGAVVNPDAVIGDGCIINTGATVDHDCKIADYVHVSVGAHVAGTVSICERTWIGAGAIISNNISVCSDCMIGAGAVVVRDIAEPGTYVGVPAKSV